MTTHSNIIPFPKVIHNPLKTRTAMSPQSVDLQPWCVDLDAIVLVTARKNELHCCCSSCISGKMLAWGVPNRTLKGILFSSVKKIINK